MQRRKLLTLSLLAAMCLSLVLAGLFILLKEPTIPEDLRDLLLVDVREHYSSHLLPGTVPTIVDKLIGFKPHRHRILEVENESDSRFSVKGALCVRLRVVYRDPGKLSVYSPGSPIEDFLYLAWRHENDWRVALLAQSGIDNLLPTHNCKDYEVPKEVREE